MKNNIIQLQEIDQNKIYLGNKTLNLKKCVDWGFNVPKFVALPSYNIDKLFQDNNFREEMAQDAIKILGSEKYAVRSSALVEDSQSESFAGQFLTKVNVSGADLSKKIYEVIDQAKNFLKGDSDSFSIIIQEYIDADISGVAFTRNPSGGREMVIEYGFCEGEKIVGGKIKPAAVSFYWNEKNENLPEFLTKEVVENFREIENKNEFPQDIEWCIKDNQSYLLQTRPITTISKKHYEQIIFLEKFLSKSEKYYFEKTEISEIAPRPSTITYDLLNFIYSKNGPVDNVYKRYGVSYKNTDFLRIIGNELFIDKEKEIQGLLPAYSYLQNKNFAPKLHRITGIFPTIKNLLFLNRIKTNKHADIFACLKTKIESGHQHDTEDRIALKQFLDDYELIFETNLLSGLSVKKVGLLLKNEPVNFTEILNGHSHFIDLTKYSIKHPQGLKGNSLDLADESEFIAIKNTENKPSNKVITWWQNIPKYKKSVLHGAIIEAIIYNRLRELGRWLTMKNINILKIYLLNYAEKYEFSDIKNIYFANFGDVLNNQINEATCIKNRDLYNRYNHFSLPNSITSSVMVRGLKTAGVSFGLANGVLQNQEFVKAENRKNEKIILYVEILSPDLTEYFDKISGIVSNNGGLLSHLAIVAREKNIPVVVGFSIVNSGFKLGDHVQIDGGSGEIKKCEAIDQ